MEATCETCRFWKRTERQQGSLGWCLRFPPRAIGWDEDCDDSERDHPQLLDTPLMRDFDWCGEHQTIPEVNPPAAAEAPEMIHRDKLSVRTRKVIWRKLGVPEIAAAVDANAVRAVSAAEWRTLKNCGPLVIKEIESVFGPLPQWARETKPSDA